MRRLDQGWQTTSRGNRGAAPWHLDGGAAINPVNQRHGQARKAALERVRRWVNPFEAKEGEGLNTGAAPWRQYV
jgi:hypothetical protein